MRKRTGRISALKQHSFCLHVHLELIKATSKSFIMSVHQTSNDRAAVLRAKPGASSSPLYLNKAFRRRKTGKCRIFFKMRELVFKITFNLSENKIQQLKIIQSDMERSVQLSRIKRNVEE